MSLSMDSHFRGTAKLFKAGQTPDQYLSGVIGPNYDRYRTAWKNTSHESIVPSFPLQLDFQLNNRCNLRCPACIWNEPETLADWSQPVTEFPYDKFCEIVSEGRDDGNLQAINFEVFNEPLLKKDLPKYIAFAAEKGVVDLTLHTNGLLLNRDWAERLIKSGLTRLMVSLDAFSQETFHKVRSSTKYERVIANIAGFLKIRADLETNLPLLRIAFLVQPANIHEREAFTSFWEQYADYVVVQELIDMTNMVDSEAYLKNDTSAPKYCSQPFYRMSIKANGEVFPCCCSLGHTGLVGGNVFNADVKTLWKSQGFERIRDFMKSGRYSQIPSCKICLDNVYC